MRRFVIINLHPETMVALAIGHKSSGLGFYGGHQLPQYGENPSGHRKPQPLGIKVS